MGKYCRDNINSKLNLFFILELISNISNFLLKYSLDFSFIGPISTILLVHKLIFDYYKLGRMGYFSLNNL